MVLPLCAGLLRHELAEGTFYHPNRALHLPLPSRGGGIDESMPDIIGLTIRVENPVKLPPLVSPDLEGAAKPAHNVIM
jgi:hypothetical protein